MSSDTKEAPTNTNSQLRLTLVISSLSPGGAERVISTMANYWVEKGHAITVITLDSSQTDFYKLDRRVKRIALGVMFRSRNILTAFLNNLRRLRAIRLAIREGSPEAVISFVDTTNVLTLISCIGLNIDHKVVSERVNPPFHPPGRIWRLLRRISYPLADCVVVQTEDVREWARSFLPEKQIRVIPNPVCPLNESPDQSGTDRFPAILGKSQAKVIIAMGRLTHQKGFDILINAFAKIAEANPEWKLVILGEGADRAALQRLVQDAGIAERVFLPGTVKNAMFFLKKADLFVMSSRYEGFPNALLEAMAAGLPVISFDCPSGPREIIRNGLDGLLIPCGNLEALTSAMGRLMRDKTERDRLASRAPEVLARFAVENIMVKWEELISHEG